MKPVTLHAFQVKQTEHKEQCALIEWWNFAAKAHDAPVLALFAIPNGGARDTKTGAALKREGVRAGIPDLFLAIPRGDFHGLFIELKKPKQGRASKAQLEALETFKTQGYDTALCHGWQAAKTRIEQYLKGQTA